MEKYRNSGRDSGVFSFEVGVDFILVKFSGNVRVYRYSYQKAGKLHVDAMKQLARSGKGLNSYINRYVKNLND